MNYAMELRNFLHSKTGTIFELLLFFAVSLSTLPIGIIVPIFVVISIGSLKLRNLKYRDIGFIPEDFKIISIVWGVLIAFCYFIIFHFLIDPLLTKITSGCLPAIFNIKGNYQELIMWILVSWTIAAFGEEIIFRGYLINRLINLLGESTTAKIIIVILAGICFGFVHFYQGIHGVISAGIIGMIQSGIYLFDHRKLTIPIIAHGAYDSFGFLNLFLS